ncbi:MAG: peptidase T, partial [Clostridia bacterium]|nr:peptidase T [Clostridia bacterium]
MRAYERFLHYVTYGTASDETTGTTPSTPSQKILGQALVKELLTLGANKAEMDDLGYVYAVLNATEGLEKAPAVGFIAHMDTSPECAGDNVKPIVTESYNGDDLPLGNGVTLRVSDFPHLPKLKGRTLITADGSTLLGADDKAGIAEIMTLTERLISENIPHGRICIAFTPDEEIGEGADHFDVPRFGADFGYTVDGDREGGVEYENFNASGAEVTVKGFSVHPGASKDTMINAALVAIEFNAMLPAADIPRHTDGYEGFFHLTDMKGDVSSATLSYI